MESNGQQKDLFGEQPAETGSPEKADDLKKFKTGEQLAQAYKELEAEFTRRSQRMQQLLRDNQALQQQLAEEKPPQSPTETVQTEKVAQAQAVSEEAPPEDPQKENPDGENPSQATEQPLQTPFSETVRRFLDRYPLAAEFADQIAQRIQAEPRLQTEDGLLQAYAQVLSGSYRTPAQILEDEKILREVVLRDDRVRAGVLREYLASLQGGAPPTLMDSGAKGFLPVTPKNAPTSLEQAAQLARNLFKQKGV